MSSQSYHLGYLIKNVWQQCANATGQDYYVHVQTQTRQYAVPAGYEDHPNDTSAIDSSNSSPQWKNNQTGRVKRTDPNPPAPQIYFDMEGIQAHIALVERSPESHEYLYRRAMVEILRFFFSSTEGYSVLREESRGEISQVESKVDMTVLKILSRPGRSLHAYDYCLVDSKKADGNWNLRKDQLSRHCGGTENSSGLVYGIIQSGLDVQFFRANRGMLAALSGVLHLRNDVNHITTWFDYMKNKPIPFVQLFVSSSVSSPPGEL